MTALALEGIVLRLGPRPLFAPVSLAIPGGTVAAVTGASGAGKSSLLACLSGTLPAAFTAEGRVLLDGEDLAGRAAERRGLGLLFQDALLFPHLSVRGNLLFGLRPGGSRRERARRADAELAAMGLDGFGTRDPATLSGGQRIRVALLRLLLAEPRALLLDEPFAALDEGNRAKVRALVFSEIRRRGIPALLVTHDESDVDAAGGPVVALTPP